MSALRGYQTITEAAGALSPSERRRLRERYNADEPRDSHGRWGSGGSSTSTAGIDALLARTPIRPGEPTFEYQSRVVNGLDPATKHEVLYRIREQYQPVGFLQRGATQWRDAHGLPNPRIDISKVHAPMAKADQVARAFEGASEQAGDPRVQNAFADFKRQNAEMYGFLTGPKEKGGLGVKVDFVKGEAYQSAKAQADDLRDNHHISVQTGLGGAHEATMSTAEYDRFRAVHDSFGHAGVGGGFDRHGEYQAWLQHMSMYTGAGRDAMSSEYHGVNTALWAGAPGTPGAGRSLLLPHNLITNPWDEKGNLVREAQATPQGTKLTSAEIDELIARLKLDGDFANEADRHPFHAHVKPLKEAYSPNEPRDAHGRWGDGGSGGASEVLKVASAEKLMASGQHAEVTREELPKVMALAAKSSTPINLETLHVDGMDHGNLFDHSATGIARIDMPQVPLGNAAQIKSFTDRLAAHGMTYTMEQISPSDLHATQDEMDARSVGKIAGAYDPKRAGVLIASRDGAVLDGHHRFAAGVVIQASQPDYKVSVMRVNAQISDLLRVGYEQAAATGTKTEAMGVLHK